MKKFITLLFILLITTACRGNQPPPTPTPDPAIPPTPTPTPAETLAQAAEVMLALRGAQIEISRTGGPAYLDADGFLVFSSATVVYAAPDRVQARVKALTSNTALELGFIAVGPDKWLTNPATLAWEKLPDNIQLDLALLFDEREGWRPLLTRDARDIQLVDVTVFGNIVRHQYRATIAGERAAAITSGLVAPQDIALDIFIDPATLHVTQLQFTVPTPTEPSNWVLQFSQFGLEVEIIPPQ
ncbi:MAG: LppX_LprAFG lipoprotein [Anaerolineae bacterium]|nr:LppX_LprAFG lipoprotein [Anaerolineae bacterium]